MNDEALQAHREAFRTADTIVVRALREVGIDVSSTQDLLKRQEPYPAAIPVLVAFLPRIENWAAKEVMARALGTREAKGKCETVLINEFDKSFQDDSVAANAFRWAIAHTFDLLGGGRGAGVDLVRLASDPRSGEAVGFLAVSAAKAKAPGAVPLLFKLLDDEKWAGFAAWGLGLMRVSEAIPQLIQLTEHPKAFFRREARTALKRIGYTLDSRSRVN